MEPDLAYSVSATTRLPRPGEIDGVHYHFMDRAAFEELAARNGFIETREYAGNLYGTPRRFIDDLLAAGRDVVMKPEVNGALAIKRAYDAAVLVFLTVPSENELEKRLAMRNTESAEAIAQRVSIARREAEAIRDYEYLVVNDEVERAAAQLHAILVAERLRVSRLIL